MLLTVIIGGSLSLIFLLFFFYLINFRWRREAFFIEKYPYYMLFIDDLREKAYDLVYSDKIRPYSIEGMRLGDVEYRIALNEFNNLMLKLLGKNLQKHFFHIFGDRETLIRHNTLFFVKKYENDRIRSTVTEKLMSEIGTTYMEDDYAAT